MFIVAKITGIVVLMWFYFTAKQYKQPKLKWTIVGLLGYWLSWVIVFLIIGDIFSATGVGLGVAYLTRKKLISNFEKTIIA